MQMYKVFDSKSQIIFSSKKINNYSILINDFSEIETYNSKGLFHFNFISDTPFESLLNWYSNYDFIDASGGLVEMNKNFLWIFRNGCWDLPKGKLEPAEDFKTAALREVQEECGLDNQLKISKLLHVSFHTYIQNSKSILKRTHWYKMNYYGQNKLKPQKEEGIEKAQWFTFKDSSNKAKISFGSVLDVWKSFSFS
jgi:8-oxo-dGTP pyrophosphatase MutT (NUDIX family)